LAPGTSRIPPAVVGNDLVFVGQDVGDERKKARVSAAAGDHQQRRPLAANFVVDLIAFGCNAARIHGNGSWCKENDDAWLIQVCHPDKLVPSSAERPSSP